MSELTFVSGHMTRQVKRGELAHLTAKFTDEQLAFADKAFAMCEANYERGGDGIVECYGVSDLIEVFPAMDLDEVRDYCGLKVEQALNARWGEDSDPQLEDQKRFEQWAAEDAQEAKDAEDQRKASHRWEY